MGRTSQSHLRGDLNSGLPSGEREVGCSSGSRERGGSLSGVATKPSPVERDTPPARRYRGRRGQKISARARRLHLDERLARRYSRPRRYQRNPKLIRLVARSLGLSKAVPTGADLEDAFALVSVDAAEHRLQASRDGEHKIVDSVHSTMTASDIEAALKLEAERAAYERRQHSRRRRKGKGTMSMIFSVYVLRDDVDYAVFDHELPHLTIGTLEDYDCAGVFQVDAPARRWFGSLEGPNPHGAAVGVIDEWMLDAQALLFGDFRDQRAGVDAPVKMLWHFEGNHLEAVPTIVH